MRRRCGFCLCMQMRCPTTWTKGTWLVRGSMEVCQVSCCCSCVLVHGVFHCLWVLHGALLTSLGSSTAKDVLHSSGFGARPVVNQSHNIAQHLSKHTALESTFVDRCTRTLTSNRPRQRVRAHLDKGLARETWALLWSPLTLVLWKASVVQPGGTSSHQSHIQISCTWKLMAASYSSSF